MRKLLLKARRLSDQYPAPTKIAETIINLNTSHGVYATLSVTSLRQQITVFALLFRIKLLDVNQSETICKETSTCNFKTSVSAL